MNSYAKTGRLIALGTGLFMILVGIGDYIRVRISLHKQMERNKRVVIESVGPALDGDYTLVVAATGCFLKDCDKDTLSRVAQWPTLNALYLWDADITDSDLAILAPLADVQYLRIRPPETRQGKLSDCSLAFIAQHFPKLRKLTIGHQAAITGKTETVDLGALCDLQELQLFDCGLTSDGLASMNLPKSLKVLLLTGNEDVDDSGLAPLAELPNLRELHLARTGVTGEDIMVLSRLTSLRLLILPRLSIPKDHIRRLEMSLPSCCIEIQGRDW